MVTKLPFQVKEYNASAKPHLTHQVVGKINDKRFRRSFRSKPKAKQCAHLKNTEAMQFGSAAAMLPEADRVMFRRCRDLLQPYGKTIEDAIKDYVPRLEQNERSSTIEKICEEIIA